MDLSPTEFPLPETMPVMVLREATLFPRSLMPLFIFEQRYRDMLNYCLEGDRMFGVACVTEGADPEKDLNPVHPVFTAGLIRACVTHDDGTSHLMLQGLRRVEILGWDQVFPFRVASIIPVGDITIDRDGEQRMAHRLLALCRESLDVQCDEASAPMKKILAILSDPVEIADMVGHNFVHDPGLRQELLEMVHVRERLAFLLNHLGGQE